MREYTVHLYNSEHKEVGTIEASAAPTLGDILNLFPEDAQGLRTAFLTFDYDPGDETLDALGTVAGIQIHTKYMRTTTGEIVDPIL